MFLADVDSAAARADSIIVWLVLGLVFLWVVAFAAEQVMSKLRPVLMFMVAAALVGVVVVRLFTDL